MTQTVTVNAGEDDDAVADPVVTLTHAVSGGDYAGLTGDGVRVTVVENNTPTLAVTDASASEADGTVDFDVTLSTASSNQITVAYASSDGTATAGSDYTAANGNLNFPAQSTATQTIRVPVIDDTEDEDEEETFTLTLSGAVNAMLPGGQETLVVTGTIKDNDVPQVMVNFGASTYEVDEGGSVSVSVTLSANPKRRVLVQWSHTSQDGATSDDYQIWQTSKAFEAGGTLTKTFAFFGVPDDVDDDGESVVLSFTNLSEGVTMGGVATTRVNIVDDDARGVTVSETDIAVPEGGSSTYTVKLDSQPTANVTVEIGGAASDVSIEPSLLTFTTSDWDLEKTVTARAAEDDDAVADDAVTLTHAVTGGDYEGLTADSVIVTITDNDTPGVTVSPTTLTVAEGGSETYTVVLDTQPSGDVTVEVGGESGDVWANLTSLTFTRDNWNITQSVTVNAAEDADAVADPVVTLTHAVSGGDYAGLTGNGVTVTVVENDTPTLAVTDASASEADGNVDFEVTLSTASSNQITVAYASSDGTATAGSDYTAANGNLTFPAQSTATQTISVPVTDDTEDEDEQETFILTLSGVQNATLAGGGTTLAATGTIVDNDDPQLTVSFERATYTVEEGTNVSVTATLTADPERTVTIPLTATGQNGADADDYSIPAFVTFDSGDTEKSITFIATGDDIDDDGESVKLGFGTLPTGVSAGSASEATVSITDDDTAGVDISEAALAIDEGSTGTYTVVLDSQPTHSVTVTVNDPSNTDVTADPAGLTFTTDGWDKEQTVTVAAAEDPGADDETTTVTHTATSTDIRYSGISVEDVDVSVTDDDEPDLVLSRPSASIQETAEEDFTVKLATKPSAQVTVAVFSGDTGAASVSTARLTFTTTDWDTAQTVTITALDDDDTSDETVTVTATASSSDQDYQGKSATVTVSITDDDTRGLVISESSLEVDEGDATGETYTVKLTTEPTGDVTVAISGHIGTDLSLDETSRTFTTTNWDEEQTVTVTAARDDDSTDDSVTLTHTASGGGYNSITKTLAVTIQDDTPDSVTVSFEQDTYTVQEGSSVPVKVKLSEDPKRSVTIPITKANQAGATDADYSGVPANLTFDGGDTEKTLSFSAVSDSDNDDGESVKLGFGTLPTGVSAGTTHESVVSITDDDVPAVTVAFEQDSYTVAEGNNVSIKVTLNSDPERTVTIPLAATPQGEATTGDYSGVPTNVVFTSGETGKGFTFAATDDELDDDGESVALGFGDLPVGVTAGSVASSTVSITDNDTRGVTVSPTTLTIDEGGSGSYTVKLDTEPSENVTVEIGGASGDVSANPASLTFTPDNWDNRADGDGQRRRRRRRGSRCCGDADPHGDRRRLSGSISRRRDRDRHRERHGGGDRLAHDSIRHRGEQRELHGGPYHPTQRRRDGGHRRRVGGRVGQPHVPDLHHRQLEHRADGDGQRRRRRRRGGRRSSNPDSHGERRGLCGSDRRQRHRHHH